MSAARGGGALVEMKEGVSSLEAEQARGRVEVWRERKEDPMALTAPRVLALPAADPQVRTCTLSQFDVHSGVAMYIVNLM
jgi:hypothetical protein